MVWDTNEQDGNGLPSQKFTVTSLTSTGATGIFAFNALPLTSNALGTKVVTNGTFNVTF